MVAGAGDTRTVYVRTTGPATEAVPHLRRILADLGPRMAIVETYTLDAFLDDRVRAEQMAAVASSGLALFGIVLLAIGCVSLFVSMVRDNVHEIAIRMALGATDGRIRRIVLVHGVRIAAVGVILGVIAARAVTTRLAGQFYAVSATDLPTFTAVPLLVLLIAAASVGHTAGVATRTDPAVHLQSD